MPQTPERKAKYARERYTANGAALRAKAAEWRDANRGYLKTKSSVRRIEKRAMCLVAAARIRARAKGISFSLGAGDIAQLQHTIDAGRCELSGVAFTLIGPRCATSPSLDRIRPALGYVPGNVRIVCHAINAAMGDWGEAEALCVMRAWVGNAIVPQVAAAFIQSMI